VRFGLTNALILTVIASALACTSFLILPQDLFYPINLHLVALLALLSIIPLVSVIMALLSRKAALDVLDKSVGRNVNALVLSIVLMNVYIFII